MMPLTDGSSPGDFKNKAIQFITKELRDPRHDYEINKLKEKITNVKSDIPEILNFCAMFYTQMHKTAKEFSQQKVALETDKEIEAA